MPKITYRVGDETTTVDATVGSSMMHDAVRNDIGGIIAECGGNAMCATCHVYVEDGPVDSLPEVGFAEDEMLDCTAAPREQNSRLSCQIPVTDALDGLTVRVADEQA
ncbi:2Fe-2S iron-sulfur cluster-binding protein [Pseudonocardia sp. N23]|uniref:2Fe-2S iron-sulfur cluster-binding protein n=1 Tax=Pseudonocardia sp. N23 TaxID=1987376 RepID=UPI000BFBF3F0|nr:2Fe-2S iron-sulfur cluster-binding protein [Pseudonocardia sp. N23]GAY07270.1 ferredoxin, 2Fe-2S [Pseudonocardia sp. N23]